MGHSVSEETKLKISIGHKGKKQSSEHIRKNSEVRKGQPSWNKGLKKGYTQEEKNKNLELIKKFYENKRKDNLRLLNNKESA